jgi:hypothetical protein
MSFDTLPSFLRPRLRLFMSVDLVGSTALKQAGDFPIKAPKEGERLRDLGPKWLLDLATFYREVQAKFEREWSDYRIVAAGIGWPASNPAQLWKVNGDELIYVQELSSCRECIAAVGCWYRACLSYRNDLKNKNSKLDVKMAAWVAGFPVANTEVIFRSEDNSDNEDWQPEVLHYHLLNIWHSGESRSGLVRDFIGPSIDST